MPNTSQTHLKLLAIVAGARGPAGPSLEAARYAPKHEVLAEALHKVGVFREAGARHTQREFQIIEQVIQLMTELYGEIDDLGTFIDRVTGVTEAIGEATVIDHLISIIHSQFTEEADYLVGSGARLDQDERIFLSHAIGCALDAFNACIDAERPYLRDRLLYKPGEPYTPPPATVVNVTNPTDVEVTSAGMLSADDLLSSEPEDAFELMAADRKPISESARPKIDRPLTETINGEFSIDANQRHPDGSFILGGRVIVEGRSGNGNRYTVESLQSGPAVFAGQYIFIDHPSMSEATDRPERSEYDKVGLLPKDPADFYLGPITEGEHAGKQALFFRNGKLSQTVDWLATRIKEGISGEMSVNAHGRGHESDDGSGEFVVEAFVPNPLTSLDFVTKGAAGGRGLLESNRGGGDPALSTLTIEQLTERRPDLVAALTAPTRETTMQEATRMALQLTEAQKQVVNLRAALRKSKRDARQRDAETIVGEALASSGLPAEGQQRVRGLLEAQVKAFVEADGQDPQGEPAGELAPAGSGMKPGDPAGIELPPDAASLPEAAQALWLEAFVGALPKGDKRATNMAWAAVYGAGWVEGTSGWYQEQAQAPAIDMSGAPAAGVDPALMAAQRPTTPEALKKAIGEAIKGEKTYLSKVTGAGLIEGLGGGDGNPADPDASATKLEEAFAGLLPADQAKVAARGRR